MISGYLNKISYFHVFFWGRPSFIFRLKNKMIFTGKRNTIFPDHATRKIIFQCNFLGKTIFTEHLKKTSYLHVIFWERSSFIFRLQSKMIFSGKRNVIFPGKTRKIIFQLNCFGKIIFSEHFEKENMVFPLVMVPSLSLFLNLKFYMKLKYRLSSL